MINAQRTGAFISSLRKANDWTQLEVARQLPVTHRAVSQWEKGTTFPDIALLAATARLQGRLSTAMLLDLAPYLGKEALGKLLRPDA